MKKAILIVLDSMGVGALPDAAEYGDKTADTLGHILDKNPKLNIPNLRALGLGNIDGVCGGRLKVDAPKGAFGKMDEESRGKDTITGHWEFAGLVTEVPFKTYPNGFPKELMDKFHAEIGMESLGNYPASGTEIIEQLGPEHEATGKPIVYTSADSVFQICANTAVIPLEKLYEMCEIARNLLVGEFACGRVIARPYIIDENGKRVRTSDRKDYAVSPTGETLLDRVSKAGQTMYAVGKISDIFNGQGIDEAVHTESNMDGVDKTLEAMKKDFSGFIFTNLVDFDSKYGHRRDPEGYARCIEDFDKRLPEIEAAMGDEDILFMVADHGNDPTHEGTDHTREYVPVVAYGKCVKAGANFGIRKSFADLGATIAEFLGVGELEHGESFLGEMKNA